MNTAQYSACPGTHISVHRCMGFVELSISDKSPRETPNSLFHIQMFLWHLIRKT